MKHLLNFVFDRRLKESTQYLKSLPGTRAQIINLSGTMKLLKKFPKATRSHGKRWKAGPSPRGGGAAGALACSPAQCMAGGAARRKRRRWALTGRERRGAAARAWHGDDARRADTRLGGAPNTGAGGRRPSPPSAALRRPPAPPVLATGAAPAFHFGSSSSNDDHALSAYTNVNYLFEELRKLTICSIEHTTDVPRTPLEYESHFEKKKEYFFS